MGKTMTVREHLAAYIDSFGISQGDAAAILDEMKAKDDTGLRWSDPVDAYPAALMAVLRVSTKSATKDWLKRNRPKHWVLAALELDEAGGEEAVPTEVDVD